MFLTEGQQMPNEFIIQPCVITLAELDLISSGMSALTDLAMKQGDYVVAQKLRNGIAFATVEIERLKKTSYQTIP